jgi:hypothetical protein
MTEPDVTLTDYGLAIECILFVYLLLRAEVRHRPIRNWFALFFGSLGLAALLGGTVHGFFLDVHSTGSSILWPMTLMAIGLTALSAWGIGAVLQLPESLAKHVIRITSVLFAGYCVAVLFITQNFLIAILHYLPATIFLFIVFCIQFVHWQEKVILIGVIGLALTLGASGIQQFKISLHPVYLNYNALYHLIQAVALFMIFISARWYVSIRPT